MNPLDLQGTLPDQYASLIFIVPIAVFVFVVAYGHIRGVLKD